MDLIDLITEMFWAPEAHADAYAWAAVLLAHATIGAMLVAMAARGSLLWPRNPVLAVAVAYGLLWEGGQLLLAGADLTDSVLDWVAVVLGAAAAMAAWRGKGRRVAALIASGMAIIWAGIFDRRRR